MRRRRLEMALEEAEIIKNTPIVMEIGGEEFQLKWVADYNFLYIEGREGFYIHISIQDDVLPKEAIIKKFEKKYQKYCDKYFW